MGWYVEEYNGCQELDEGDYVVTRANDLSKGELIDTIVELCNIAKVNLHTDDANDIIDGLKEQVDFLTHANTRLQEEVSVKDKRISDLKSALEHTTQTINYWRTVVRKCERLARENGVNIYEESN